MLPCLRDTSNTMPANSWAFSWMAYTKTSTAFTRRFGFDNDGDVLAVELWRCMWTAESFHPLVFLMYGTGIFIFYNDKTIKWTFFRVFCCFRSAVHGDCRVSWKAWCYRGRRELEVLSHEERLYHGWRMHGKVGLMAHLLIPIDFLWVLYYCTCIVNRCPSIILLLLTRVYWGRMSRARNAITRALRSTLTRHYLCRFLLGMRSW